MIVNNCFLTMFSFATGASECVCAMFDMFAVGFVIQKHVVLVLVVLHKVGVKFHCSQHCVHLGSWNWTLTLAKWFHM